MASGRLRLHLAVKLLPAVVGRCRHLLDLADIGDGLALIEELLSGAQLADGLLGGCGACVLWSCFRPSMAG